MIIPDNILQYVPEQIFGIYFFVFVGLIIGCAVACYEGIWTKYVKFKVKVGNMELKFDKRYLASLIVTVIVLILSMYVISETQAISFLENKADAIIPAVGYGFSTSYVVIRTINTRVTMYIGKKAQSLGLDDKVVKTLTETVQIQIDGTPQDDTIFLDENLNIKKKPSDYEEF